MAEGQDPRQVEKILNQDTAKKHTTPGSKVNKEQVAKEQEALKKHEARKGKGHR